MADLQADWDKAAPSLADEWEKATPSRKTPKQMQIGAGGFGQAMEEVLKEHPIAGRVAAFGAVPRQLYEGAKQLLGRQDPQAIEATRKMEQTYPGAALAGGAATAGLASLVPGGASLAGQTTLGALTGALTPTMGDESRMGNIALGGVGGLAGGAIMKGAGALGERVLQRGTTAAGERASQNAVRDATIREAQAAGLVLPPSVTGSRGMTNKALESIGGKAATAQEASIRNQQTINRIAKQEAGLGPQEDLTEGNLAKARQRLAEPYRQVAALSPRAAQSLEMLQEARLDAKDSWKKYALQSGPENRKAAMAADEAVNHLEFVIDMEARKAGQPELVKQLRAARVAIAKNHDVETALNVGSGNVEASDIGKMLDRRGSNAVTGGLGTIGRFQQAFPDYVRAKPSGQAAPGVGYLKYPVALALGMEGYDKGEHLGIGPYGAAAGLLALAGGPARSIALSQLMQHTPQYVPGLGSRMAGAIAGRLPQTTVPLSAIQAGLISRMPDEQ